ncbi:DUF5367 family protein [Acetobacter sacchari]|uniref:DUF5367 family protein n=1 Tax=Acetobacter sacchari TaxID=2661687 RepID=A0ABS3LS59_9PROT|nr:DUF5367 family protein [Acetobacter sacchari]MBO1358757.1 DUF5367 family protein [Acetobacter sacchari]
MLHRRQIIICIALALLFWGLATTYLHYLPGSLTGWRGDVGFLTSVPVALYCIWAVRRYAGLTREQLPSGALVVLGVAMLCDATALRWFSSLYSTDDRVCRVASAWLLWGYGVSALGALFFAWRRQADATL